MAIKNKKIGIVGSGLVGALLAILLAEEGFDVDIYEKRKDPHEDGAPKGRTITLSLSDRGWKALKQVGLEPLMKAHADPAYGRAVHEKDGSLLLQDYGDGTQGIYTVKRNYLNTILLEKALATGRATFFFEHSLIDINENTGELVFAKRCTGETIKKQYDHIIAVDGAFSTVREKLAAKGIWNFDISQLTFGYKPLHIPKKALDEHDLADHRVHVWPRKNSVLMGFPTESGDLDASIFLPLTGPDSLESIDTPEKLISFFKREYSNALPLMPELEELFFKNPTSILTQVIGGPWNYEDKVLLMGDACHAMTPFYGMGMNVGFEDCLFFIKTLRENNNDLGRTFRSLSAMRKPSTDAMTHLSYENFQSLNESPDPHYQEHWLLERRIWKLLPDQWTPVYVLIAFSETSLVEIPKIKERQDRIVHRIISEHQNHADLSDEQLTAIVKGFYEE